MASSIQKAGKATNVLVFFCYISRLDISLLLYPFPLSTYNLMADSFTVATKK